jgi:putative ABC transport system permease protein
MESLWKDAKYGARALLKKPAFTIVAVVTLALGIGANTAIFSVVYSVLLKPLPYREHDRLFEVREFSISKSAESTVSPGNFIEWRKQQTVFERLEAHRSVQYDLTGAGEPERIPGERVTAGFFDMLGVSPLHGRSFSSDEDQPGRDNVVILSYSLWQRRFGASLDTPGRTLMLDGRGYTVIAIMPPDFQFPGRSPELWTLMAFTARDAQNYGGRYISAIGRLKPGARAEQAAAEMDTIAGRLARSHPQYNAGAGIKIVPLLEYTVRSIRSALEIFFVAVAFVLLIVCANVANLQLARAAARHKEVAIRAALGATRSRLIRQMLVESVLLSLAGGVLGLIVAAWGVSGLMALSPDLFPRAQEIAIDANVLGFTVLLSLLTGILFGLAPALQASKPDLNEGLKEGGRSSSADTHRPGLRNILVVAEIGLSLVLLIGAGLLIKSFVRLLDEDPGFNPQNVLTMRLSLPRELYSEDNQVADFYEQLLQRARSVAGVESAGLISILPLEPRSYIFSFNVDGETTPADGEEHYANLRWTSPGYFEAMGITLLSGRYFNERDRISMPGAIIVNQALARRFFPDQDPVGKRLLIPSGQGFRGEVVGVVSDSRQRLNLDPGPELYVSALQFPTGAMTLVARTGPDPASMASALRDQVRAIDAQRPVSAVQTLEQVFASSVAERRFYMLLSGIFAALAVALAAIGIYGVMSYTVAQSTREIGIRMAIGAQVGDVLKLVVGRAMMLTFIGVAAGAGGALALTRLMSSLLYGVTPTDPATFVSVSALLIGVAAAACYVPARRATRVDPLIALRYE